MKLFSLFREFEQVITFITAVQSMHKSLLYELILAEINDRRKEMLFFWKKSTNVRFHRRSCVVFKGPRHFSLAQASQPPLHH